MRKFITLLGLATIGLTAATLQAGVNSIGELGAMLAPRQIIAVVSLEAQQFGRQLAELRQTLETTPKDKWSESLWASSGAMLKSQHGPFGQGLRYSIVLIGAYLLVQGGTIALIKLMQLGFIANLFMAVGFAMFITGMLPSLGLVTLAIGTLLKFGQLLDYFTPSRVAHFP